ncbi:MAG: glycosyltransferase family 2 protein [Acidobacteriota bacterium]|nr:glycosyltransferase family 2 protein [Acidobacteriota bacterium]
MVKKIEIVTPVHNRKELTLQFLQSLKQIDDTDLQIHIIIVDDGSTDGTAEAVQNQFPAVEIVRGDGNLWYTAGTNLGIKTALKYKPDFVLTVNNDSVFDRNFLRYLVQTAEKYPRSVVGATLLLWDEPERLFQTSPKWETFGGGWRHWYEQTIETIPDKPWEVGIIVGNCVLFPVGAIREVGLMDEKRLVQFGDAEYTPRMRKKGWRLLIEPRARVFCKPNDVPPQIRRMPFGKMIKTLFFDSTNVASLKRKLQTNLAGAPNRFAGAVAFAAFLARAVTKTTREQRKNQQKEKPLAETFAKAVVKD